MLAQIDIVDVLIDELNELNLPDMREAVPHPCGRGGLAVPQMQHRLLHRLHEGSPEGRE